MQDHPGKLSTSINKPAGNKPAGIDVRWLPLLLLVVAVVSIVVILPMRGEAATAPSLGVAESFAVLAGSAITDTGTTSISGDVGLRPETGAAITGLTCLEMTGSSTIYDGDGGYAGGGAEGEDILACRETNDGLLETAKANLATAYNNLVGQPPAEPDLGTELGGTTVKPGVYKSTDGTFEITGTVTLDGENLDNPVFVFQMGTTLTTASASDVILINGAQACNVFWQVGSSATLGTNSSFSGNILALESITLTTGASVTGRVLALNSAVTMDTNTITVDFCDVATSTPTESDPSTPDSSATATEIPDSTNTTVPGATNTTVPGATNTTVPGATNTTVPGATSTVVPVATSTVVPAATATQAAEATATQAAEATATQAAEATATQAAEATATQAAAATATQAAEATATQAAEVTATQAAEATATQAAEATATQAAAATATQVAEATATQAAEATATQAAAATATQVAEATATSGTTSSVPATPQGPAEGAPPRAPLDFQPPTAGDGGLLSQKESGNAALGVVLAAIVLLGGLAFCLRRNRRRMT